MKSYDETISNVFDRIGEYETKQKRKRSNIIKTTVSFCCVCAIAIVGVGVLKGNNTPAVNVDDALYPGIKDTFDDLANTETPDNNVIVFNETSEKIASKMGIALFRDDEIKMTKDEIIEYFGVDVFPTCPDGFTEKPGWLGIYRRDKGTGEVYSDFNQVRYFNADNSKGIAVSFGTNSIFYLTEYYLGDKYNDIQKSVINNIEIPIVEVKSENYFYAEFTYKGVMFNICSENVTQVEFLSVIYSIIEK